jgi:deoxyribodipyrimidine photo-lyase
MDTHVFIFRRDLRTEDNAAWRDCCRHVAAQANARVAPVFIFSPSQIDPARNPYYGARCVRFMLESLGSLRESVPVQFFEAEETVDVLARIPGLAGAWFNRDLTPFARARDAAIEAWCKKDGRGVMCESREDYTMHSVDAVRNKTGGPYQVYTPFYNAARVLPVAAPRSPASCPDVAFAKIPGAMAVKRIDAYAPPRDAGTEIVGGRAAGLAILARIRRGEFRRYGDERNDMEISTTRLAAYLKFGCISIREAYAAMVASPDHDVLLGELYWREFYFHLTWHNPRVLALPGSGRPNAAFKVAWENTAWRSAVDPEVRVLWKAWCEGKTGYPIVDAGMRQLLATGFMHNRARMIVAMFLTKHLRIHWRDGERFFAQQLIDYDPCQNSGGWAWSASVGVDTQPYRLFNPWLQAARYDPDCAYVRRWVPELAGVPTKDILHWDKRATAATATAAYPMPIVEHSKAAKEAMAMMKAR